MNMLDYIFLKLQKNYYDKKIKVELLSGEKDFEINNNLYDLLKKYNLTYEEAQKYFKNKYKQEFNESNFLSIFTDKMFLNIKKSCFLEIKNIVPKKTPQKVEQNEYFNILNEFAEKKIHHRYDAVYKIPVPIKYFTLNEMTYLSSFKILRIAGLENTAVDILVNLIAANKFEEFNYMLSKKQKINNNGMCDFLFSISDFCKKNKTPDETKNFIYEWKTKSINIQPDFFKHIEELTENNNLEIYNFVEKINNDFLNVFIKIDEKYNESNINSVFSFIYMLQNIEEIMTLKRICTSSNKENVKIKKRM